MTRKNMGGVAIDMQARVLNRAGQPVPGLFASGELTGSVGINGSHGMDGTFLGPAIMTGRLAGKTIAEAAGPRPRTPGTLPRDGFWHFEVSHRIVTERKYACTMCHTPELPPAPVTTRAQREAQTQVCVHCHDR